MQQQPELELLEGQQTRPSGGGVRSTRWSASWASRSECGDGLGVGHGPADARHRARPAVHQRLDVRPHGGVRALHERDERRPSARDQVGGAGVIERRARAPRGRRRAPAARARGRRGRRRSVAARAASRCSVAAALERGRRAPRRGSRAPGSARSRSSRAVAASSGAAAWATGLVSPCAKVARREATTSHSSGSPSAASTGVATACQPSTSSSCSAVGRSSMALHSVSAGASPAVQLDAAGRGEHEHAGVEQLRQPRDDRRAADRPRAARRRGRAASRTAAGTCAGRWTAARG